MSHGGTRPVALITGGAQRIGAAIAAALHDTGYNIVIHYRHSHEQAQTLVARFNAERENSAIAIAANLCDLAALKQLAEQAASAWGRLDVLINNASSFYPTPIARATEQQWDDLIGSNMKAPFFLAQALADALQKQRGCIINIADIYAEKPLPQHSIYCMAKAGNAMLTQSLACELAPRVRVNGIAPGVILWPSSDATDSSNDAKNKQAELLRSIPLQRQGSVDDIANTILFLVRDAPYITGQIIAVDGGRRLLR